jgi:hypothetical protein
MYMADQEFGPKRRHMFSETTRRQATDYWWRQVLIYCFLYIF